MKALIVYDSQYGNTEAVATAIRDAFEGDAKLVRADKAMPGDVAAYEMILVGSPTQGGRPTQAVKRLLDAVPAGALEGKGVAAFDTRIPAAGQNALMRLVISVLGYAAPRIAKGLEAKGGKRVTSPEGFRVTDKEGPLEAGELERARAWGTALANTMASQPRRDAAHK